MANTVDREQNMSLNCLVSNCLSTQKSQGLFTFLYLFLVACNDMTSDQSIKQRGMTITYTGWA